MPISYASAASGTSSGLNHNHSRPRKNNTKQSSFALQVQELSEPPPESLTLTAALQLLEPLDTNVDVYLMSRSYVQNWIIWAYHQKVGKVESPRVEAALRLAADRLGLSEPALDMPFSDPGPIDSSLLSMEGYPLLLTPNVEVVDGLSVDDGADFVPEALRRVKSLPIESKKESKEAEEDVLSEVEETLDEKDDKILCCAVSERFYESLRRTHGVACNDGCMVSFQPYPKDADVILHHHRVQADDVPNNQLRPIEFRRKVIIKSVSRPPVSVPGVEDAASPMTKLLQQEERLNRPQMIPVVEAHPVRLCYKITHDNSSPTKRPQQGFVLVSQRASVYGALQALMKVAAPTTSSSCKRVWSKRGTEGTNSGDGYELVNIDHLDGKLLSKDMKFERPKLLIGEWIRAHGEKNMMKDFEVLVETKSAKGGWPRASLALENRIKVGDFVDAQDSTGKWYEALVREVAEDVITVHYLGWASRWDSKVRRRIGSVDPSVAKNFPARVLQPAPLWTHSSRWREKMQEGKVLEVRDSSSRAERPKWYKGVVKSVSRRGDKAHEIGPGAELEQYETTVNGKVERGPLLLLNNRKAKILVEVEQELGQRNEADGTGIVSIGNSESADTLVPQPPYLRWVYLNGEEICEAGTHMKLDPEEDPAVVTLRYEFESGRKPVEIMKSFNNMFGSGFMKESMVGSPPAPGSVGMHNLGNSCFLNSIIQCLNHMDPLTQYFLKNKFQQDLNRQNPLGSGGHVATAYAALLREVWGGKYSALAPRMLKQTVASFAPQFNNSYQHDSQEFCQFLMDGLHEDCNRVKEKPYVEELEGFGMADDVAAIETWRKHLLRHDSIIVDHCQGMHRSHLTCPVCGRESIKFDVFSTISLPLSQEKGSTTINLEDCIEKFMEGEQLDDLNAWYCPSCKKHVCALKMIALWSVPDVLILHLKRFTFENCSIRNEVVRSKIEDKIKFPIENLDMRRHVLGPIDKDAPPVYTLFGVSEHTGPTANSGHYTATVRNSKDGRWYRYNDAHVGETTGDAAITGGAYLLFYRRTKGLSRWAGMETEMKTRGVDPYGGLETDLDGFTKISSTKKKKH